MYLDPKRPQPDPSAPVPVVAAVRARGGEDAGMLRLAARLSRELGRHRPAVYWGDLIVSAVVGYAALAVTIGGEGLALRLAASLVAVLALYRAGSFIHEISHMKPGDVPGFRLVWNLLVGIPLLMPSFMYEGVHSLHHSRTRYGTVRDPEYLPLATSRPRRVIGFVAIAALGPIGLLLRYGLLGPLSLLSPRLRAIVFERFSALAINPDFRRETPEGGVPREWRVIEAATGVWALTLVGGTVAGLIPAATLAIFLGVLSASLVLNQVRTLAAHLWENEGEAMGLTDQYLDSVNVPPPALMPALWAPVGLRYHALHHLLPSLPYHALGAAHRALVAELPAGSAYHGGNHPTLGGVVRRLLTAAAASRRATLAR